MPEFKADTDGFMKKPSGFKMKGWTPYTKKTDPPKSAEDQMKELNKKYKKQMDAKMDSIQNVYQAKSNFSADSLNKAVNKDIELYNKGEISQNELKKRRPGVAFKKLDDNKSPHETIQNLKSKKEAGTITKAELKKLDKLTKKWDKIYAGSGDDDRG